MSIFKTLVVSIFVATVDGYPEVMVVKTPKGKGNSSIPALADPLKNCPFGVVRGDKTEARCATVDDYMVVASNSSETTQVAEVSSGSASFPNFDDPGRLNAERRQIAKGKNGVFLDYHFLRPVRGRQRLRSKNPCYVHDKKDGYEGVYCLPSFYILGPQKCGTTDTFDKTMRHVDVVRLNPKQGELLEPHLFTNQIDESLAVLKHSSRRKGPPAPLLFRNSQRQFSRHQNELLAQKRIAGDASADLMYRMALPQMPSALLMHAVQPDAKLIAVLRDPVERTYSDFRFFFHCGVGFFHFEKCPLWWPHPHVNDLRQPAKRFHAVVETEVAEFKACLRGTERKQLFPPPSKVTHARPPPRSSRRRLLHGGSNQSSVGSSSNVGTSSSSGIRSSGIRSSGISSSSSSSSSGVNASVLVGDTRRKRRRLDTGRGEEGSTSGLLYSNPELLRACKYREDLNRDAGLNKCYSGRAVLSVYAAFLVDWLAHFPGQQLLVLPLEGLDTTPRNWIGGVYSFLGLRPPREHEWQDIAPGTTPTSDFTRKKQQPATPAQAQTAGGVSGEGAGVFIVRKTSDTLSCGHGLPDVHFGPMQANTRLHLQRFFNPWNDELRKLLLDKKVHTVPGYGLSPNSNPLRFPSSDAHSEAKAAAKSRGGKSSSSSSSSNSLCCRVRAHRC